VTPAWKQDQQAATPQPQVAPVGQGTVLLEEGQQPFQQAPAPQAPDIAMFNPEPITVQDQTSMGPIEMTFPSPAQQGINPNLPIQPQMAAPQAPQATSQAAGIGTVLKPTAVSEQFSAAGVQKGSFIPQKLGAQPAAPTSPQANFESRMATGIPLTPEEVTAAQGFAQMQGLAFDPQTGYTQSGEGPKGLAEFGGRTLSQYLTDPTVERAGLMTDAQGRMIDPTVDRSKFEAASAARSAAAGPNLQSIAGAPRPGVDVPSLAMQRSRMEAGLDPVAGAPTGMSQQQQRDQLERGVDPATGQAIERDGLTPYQRASLDWQKQKFGAEQASKDFDRALKVAKSEEEKAALQQEMSKKEQDLYQLHQDRYSRQERYIDQALKNTGILSTGFAALSKFAPGTPARDLEESLKPILGEAAFGRLQEMRDASKTGGALGQVSEKELALLESAMGALSTSQSEKQFRANLLAYRKQLRESNKRIQAAAQGQPWSTASGQAPRYENDVDDGRSLDDILLPPSK